MTATSRLAWVLARCGYRAALVGLFALLALKIEPNVHRFGRLTAPGPEDYATFVNERCAPILRAMAKYERDTGRPVGEIDELAPKYVSHDQLWYSRLDYRGEVIFDPGPYLRIRYTPRSGTGSWAAEGRYVSGPIPAEPVPEYQPRTLR